VGYSIGTDVYNELVLMPALWEAMVEGQFELEVYANLPFALSRMDPAEVSAPILTTRQKSIAAREAANRAAEEHEKQRRIREHRSRLNREKLQTMETGEFTLREDNLAPRAARERLLQAEQFYGSGMLAGEPSNMERTLLRDTIRATMPHQGLDYPQEQDDEPEKADDEGEHQPPLPAGGLGLSVSDLSSASVSSHIASVRASIAVKIKKDTDARLFSLRMKTIDNATRTDFFEGVGDSAPLPKMMPPSKSKR